MAEGDDGHRHLGISPRELYGPHSSGLRMHTTGVDMGRAHNHTASTRREQAPGQGGLENADYVVVLGTMVVPEYLVSSCFFILIACVQEVEG
eukprot:5106484-Pyramimonas_sp.AAC.1